MAVCKGSRRKIGEIFISSCHLPVAAECDIVIVSEPSPNPIGSSWAVLLTQLIPARGRKPVSTTATAYGPGHNLSPRGDGNTRFSRISCGLTGHNLSPRGDGNPKINNVVYSSCLTQLIPARGRKLGMKRRLQSGAGHNLSPRGDGNDPCSGNALPSLRTQLIPARGRKLTLAFHLLSYGHNLSPQGDGNLI